MDELELGTLLNRIDSELRRRDNITSKLAPANEALADLRRKREGAREQLGSAQAKAELDGVTDRSFFDKLRKAFRDDRDELEIGEAKVEALQRELRACEQKLLGYEDQLRPAQISYWRKQLDVLEPEYLAAAEHLADITRKIIAAGSALEAGVRHLQELRIPYPSSGSTFVKILEARFVYDRHVVVYPATEDPVASRFTSIRHSLGVITKRLRQHIAETERREQEGERQRWLNSQPGQSFASTFEGSSGQPVNG
jgi:hypothetical protein